MAAVDLQKVNFMSQARFDEMGSTQDNQMYMVEQSFLPSGKYDSLTWANQGRYVAPADGVFVLNLAVTTSNVNRCLSNIDSGYLEINNTYNTGVFAACSCPAKKGETVLTWVSGGSISTAPENSLRFHYY